MRQQSCQAVHVSKLCIQFTDSGWGSNFRGNGAMTVQGTMVLLMQATGLAHSDGDECCRHACLAMHTLLGS